MEHSTVPLCRPPASAAHSRQQCTATGTRHTYRAHSSEGAPTPPRCSIDTNVAFFRREEPPSENMPPRWMRTADVSLFEAIRSYTDVSASSFLVCVACLIGVADVGCAVALYGVVHSWAPGSWGPLVMLQHMWGDQNFSKDTADILLLVVARLSVLPLIAFLAATKGKPPNAAPASTASSADNASDGNSSRAGRGRTNQVAGKKKSLWRRACSCFGYG
ncbi:unnamed protein product [Ectocarpus sp. 12 AP-2014]